MTSQTVMMFFKVSPKWLEGIDFVDQICNIAEICVGKMKSKSVLDVGNGDSIIVVVGENNNHASFRTFHETGIITLDIYYSSVENIRAFQDNKYNLEYIRTLESKIRKFLGSSALRTESIYTPIKRGDGLFPYFVTSDERIYEPDYDKIVFECDSKWQNIKILHSDEIGNVLFLDNDVMYGENDWVYSETLLGLGNEKRENYEGKEVLILGGGDGGLINLLRKENPKMVTMVEIDEEVIKACRTHMRVACGDAMDEFKGPNHEIIIDDCMNILLNYHETGKKVDYVVNDLTEFPVDKQTTGYSYDFETSSRILELGLQILRPGGKFLARGNCLKGVDYRDRFESDIKKLGAEFICRNRHVKSFTETYCLYEIWMPFSNGKSY